METIQINNIEDFRNHIRKAFGEQMIHNIIGNVALDNATNNCSAIEAEKIACEDFYEGTLLVDEEAGFIKFNISKEDILNSLWDIYANDPGIS